MVGINSIIRRVRVPVPFTYDHPRGVSTLTTADTNEIHRANTIDREVGERDSDMALFINGIDAVATESQVNELLTPLEGFVNCCVPRYSRSPGFVYNSGFLLAYFDSTANRSKAIEALSNKLFLGRHLKPSMPFGNYHELMIDGIPPSATIYVTCIPDTAKSADLVNYFSRYGKIVHISFPQENDSETRFVACAWITFSAIESAMKAVKLGKVACINRRRVLVRFCKRSPTHFPDEADNVTLTPSKLIVYNVNINVQFDELSNFFSQLPGFVGMYIPRMNPTKRENDCGFVELNFESSVTCNAAAKYLSRNKFDGRPLSVRVHSDTKRKLASPLNVDPRPAGGSMLLFVKGIPSLVSQDDFITAMQEIGHIQQVTFIAKQFLPFKCAIVKCGSRKIADIAIARNGSIQVGNHVVDIRYFRPKSHR